jgi:hypothetical protein
MPLTNAGEVLVGPRGGSYYVDKDGVRVYLVSRKKPSRNYNPPTPDLSHATIYKIKSNRHEKQNLSH